MPSFHLSTSIHALILFLLAFGSGAAAMYAYRVTVPPLPRVLRRMLAVIRGCALFLLVMLIAQPLLTLISTSRIPPMTIVLVDNSRSMTISDRQGDRKSALLGALSSPSIRSLSNVGAVRFALFDSRTRILRDFSADSVTCTGEATDIASAFLSVKHLGAAENIQSVLLLSDGNSTVGSNPVYAADDLGIPVFAIGVGDTSDQKDVLVSNVISNEIAYAGSRVPVRAIVRSNGYAGDRVEILLRDSAVVLDRKTLTLEAGTREYSVPLSFVPNREGLHRYSVESTRLPGELSYKNNSESFFTQVLKSKLRISLIAGSPGTDVSFVRRAVEQDKDFALSPHVESTDGEYYDGPPGNGELSSTDCILLVGFPAKRSRPEVLEAVIQHADSGTPVFFVTGRNVDPDKLQELARILPVEVLTSTGDEHQAFVTVPVHERTHPILKTSLPGPSPDAWSKLPPVFRSVGLFRAKPGTEVLLMTHETAVPVDDPFVVARSNDGKKSLAVLGYGLWRWNLFSDIPGPDHQVLQEFVSNGIRWLTTREDTRRVKVRPFRRTFSTQDHAEFAAEVYDESLQPIDDARVQVVINHDSATDQILLSSVGNGQYEGAFDQLPEGSYNYTATVHSDGRLLGRDGGTFAVGGSSAEFQTTKMNRALLQQLAVRTRGAYYEASNLEALPTDVERLSQLKARDLVSTSEVEIWHSPLALALVIALLATEWTLRKRNGML